MTCISAAHKPSLALLCGLAVVLALSAAARLARIAARACVSGAKCQCAVCAVFCDCFYWINLPILAQVMSRSMLVFDDRGGGLCLCFSIRRACSARLPCVRARWCCAPTLPNWAALARSAGRSRRAGRGQNCPAGLWRLCQGAPECFVRQAHSARHLGRTGAGTPAQLARARRNWAGRNKPTPRAGARRFRRTPRSTPGSGAIPEKSQ